MLPRGAWPVRGPPPRSGSCGRPSPRLYAVLQDHYKVLEVDRTASDVQIKHAYRRLARLWHPDLNGSPDAEETFKAVSQAFETLADAELRRAYDVALKDYAQPTNTRQSWPGAGSSPRPGADLRATLLIDLADAVLGSEHTLTVAALADCKTCCGSGGRPGGRSQQCQMCKGRGEFFKTSVSTASGTSTALTCCPLCAGKGIRIIDSCHACGGSGLTRQGQEVTVRVAAGSEGGTTMRVLGAGDAGEAGGACGDLLVYVSVRQSEALRRRGLDLHSEVEVPLFVALLGGTVGVETLRNGRRRLAVPPGTQHGDMLPLQQEGVDDSRRGRGAHVFTVRVRVPREVDGAEEGLLRRLAQLKVMQSAGAAGQRTHNT